jgi:hypothetical protein
MKDEEEPPLVWSISDEFPQELIGIYDRQGSPDRFEFRRGEAVREDIGTPTFMFGGSLEELEAWDVLPNDALLPLVAVRMAAVLMQEAPGQSQLLDAVVQHRGGVATVGWKLVNITKAIQAIDHAASEYSLIQGTGQILGFKKLRYRRGALGRVKIARDAEYKSHILVAPSLAAALQANGARGLALREDEDLDV